MDSRLLLSLSDLCLTCLCRTASSSADILCISNVPASALPSIAEILLSHSEKRVLPEPVSNLLLEGLAQRGRLTSRVLDLLLWNRRFLKTLPLYSLMKVDDEEAIVERLRKQEHLKSVNISFSPCLGNLPVPFLENLVGTPSTDSLTYFAANHVTGAIGCHVLDQFSNMKHLNLSFTNLEKNDFCAAMTSMRHLEHLNISGTTLSWFDVFSIGDKFASNGLTELLVHSLEIMRMSDFQDGMYPHTTVEPFFKKLQRLVSLDVSYALVGLNKVPLHGASSCDARFYVTLHRILHWTRSLTHLDVSNSCDWDTLVDLLITTNRLNQLQFLGNLSSSGNYSTVPETLIGRPSLKLALSSFVSRAFCYEYQFHQSHALKNGDYAYESHSEMIDDVLKTDYDRFVSSGLVPLTLMLCTATRRCLTDNEFFNDSFMMALLLTGVPAFVCASAPFMTDALEQLLENLLLFSLRHKSNNREFYDESLAGLVSLLAQFATFIAERNVLRHLALQFSLLVSPPEDASIADKWVLLAPILSSLSPHNRMKLTSKIGRQMTSNLSEIVSRNDEYMEADDNIKVFMKDRLIDLFEGGTSLLNSFVYLFCGLPSPDVFSAFGAILPVEAIADLTQIAFDSFATNVDKRSSKLYVASVEALCVLAESFYLAPTLFSKQVFNTVLSRLPPEKNMHVAYSYLACLLLVHDQSVNWWPSHCEGRENLAVRIFTGDYSDVDFTYRHATLLPLLKIARSREFRSVTAFGLKRFAFFCGSDFDAKAYHSVYSGPCPVSLIKEEVGVDTLISMALSCISDSPNPIVK